jgi:hypothetical protein
MSVRGRRFNVENSNPPPAEMMFPGGRLLHRHRSGPCGKARRPEVTTHGASDIISSECETSESSPSAGTRLSTKRPDTCTQSAARSLQTLCAWAAEHDVSPSDLPDSPSFRHGGESGRGMNKRVRCGRVMITAQNCERRTHARNLVTLQLVRARTRVVGESEASRQQTTNPFPVHLRLLWRH